MPIRFASLTKKMIRIMSDGDSIPIRRVVVIQAMIQTTNLPLSPGRHSIAKGSL